MIGGVTNLQNAMQKVMQAAHLLSSLADNRQAPSGDQAVPLRKLLFGQCTLAALKLRAVSAMLQADLRLQRKQQYRNIPEYSC